MKAATKKVEPVKAAVSGSSSSSDSSSSDSSDSDSSDSEDEAPKKDNKRKASADAAEAPAAKAPAAATTDSNDTKIYVRGLPWVCSEEELRDFMKECGEMTSVELPLQDDGRASGTAFITFADAAGAAACIAKDGATFGERWLSMKYSTERMKSASESSRPPSEKQEGCMCVFIGNLSWDVDEPSVRACFESCGEITAVRFAEDKETGRFKGFGHVEFSTTEATDAAVAMAGTDVVGRPIRVDFAAVKQRPAFGAGGGGRGGGGRGGGRGGSPTGGRGGGGRGGGGRGYGDSKPAFASGPGAKKNGSVAAFTGSKITF